MNENKTAITEFVEWLENVNIYGDISYPEMWGEVMDKARALEASQAEKDKGLWEMLYKKLYPYPCGESNNRVRLDGSSLDIWFTKDEVDLIISRHQSNPIDPDYAESKAWKEKMGKMAKEQLPRELPTVCASCDYGRMYKREGFCTRGYNPCINPAPLAPKPEAKTEEGLREELTKFGQAEIRCWEKLWEANKDGEHSTAAKSALEAAEVFARGMDDVLSRHSATLEPLAVLADRHKWCYVHYHKTVNPKDGPYTIELADGYQGKIFTAPTYAACEQLARTWLEEQKEGK